MSNRLPTNANPRRSDLPADLDPVAVAAAIRGRRIGGPVLARARVTSTMDELAERAEAGVGQGLVLIADFQSAGRGRLERGWEAPAGTALLLSILFHPPLPPQRWGEVNMVVGLAACDALAPCLPPTVPPVLKWPNDVLAGGGKIAGLLAEVHEAPAGAGALIVGLGLNISQSADQLPPGAASLASLGVPSPERTTLARDVLVQVNDRYDQLIAGVDVVGLWADRLDTLGRDVVATGPRGTVRGRAVGVAPDGALRIRTDAGQEVVVRAGDVTLRA